MTDDGWRNAARRLAKCPDGLDAVDAVMAHPNWPHASNNEKAYSLAKAALTGRLDIGVHA